MKIEQLQIGKSMPAFRSIMGTDGKEYSSSDLTKKILVVVFSCNHCPYVQAYEGRMIDFQTTYASQGVQLVAINSNDSINYPEDSFEYMVKRAGSKGFNFIYLRDETQEVAELFGATHTPQFFVFDAERKLRYSGKMDDNWKEPTLVKERYLYNAVDALLEERDVPMKETYSIGCTIKWR